MIENIRKSFGRKEMDKLRSRRQRVLQSNWSDIKTVGVLYDAGNPAYAAKVGDLYRYLYQDGKQVFTLGFMAVKDPKQLPAARLGFDYFSKRELSPALIPKGTRVENFLNEPFDLLLDLNIDRLFPLHALSVISRAKFKAGMDFPGNGHLSFTIHLGAMINREEMMEDLIFNLRNYLRELRVA